MAITVNNTYSGTSGSSLSNVVTSASTQKLVFVSSTRSLTDSDREISTVTRNGIAFTRVVVSDALNNTRSEVWYQDSPSVGTYSISITYVGVGPGFATNGCLVLTGAASGGAEATNTDSAASGANPSLSVTATADAIVLDACCYDNSDAGFAFGASQTTLYNTATTRRRTSSYKNGVSAGSVTMSQTNTTTDRSYLVASFPTTAPTTITPSRVAATASVAAVGLATKVFPSRVAATATVPSSTVKATATVTPSRVSAVATVPTPGRSTRLTAVSVNAPSTVYAAGRSTKVFPSRVASSASVAVTGLATKVFPSRVAAAASVASPSVRSTAVVVPSRVAASSSIPSAAVQASAAPSASRVASAVTVASPSPR